MTGTIDLQQVQEEHWPPRTIAVLVLHDRGQYIPRHAVHKHFAEFVPLCERFPGPFDQWRDCSRLRRLSDHVPLCIAITIADAEKFGKLIARLERHISPCRVA